MTKLEQKQQELTVKQQRIHEVFEAAGEDIDFTQDSVLKLTDTKNSGEAVKRVQEWNVELDDIGKECESLQALVAIRDRAAEVKNKPVNAPALPGSDPPAEPRKSFGQAITDSPAFKRFRENRTAGRCIVDGYGMKTLFERDVGWAPESLRVPGLVIDAVTRPIQVTDLIPPGTTGMAVIKYMEETTRDQLSAERSENAAYAESAFALTQRTSDVESIGTSVPVTDEQLEDVPGVQSYLEQRLVFGNRQRLDSQFLNGDGTPPNLRGFKNKSGVQTQAKGADPVPDAIYKAMTLVRVTGRAFPNAVILHPNDWQDIRLLRTGDGIYIWGSPSEAGPERIWGIQVVQSDAQDENTGLVGDYANFCQTFERRGMEVAMGFVNDDFLDGRVTIRAGFRVAFVIYRATAYCKVTGI